MLRLRHQCSIDAVTTPRGATPGTRRPDARHTTGTTRPRSQALTAEEPRPWSRSWRRGR
jgi:hypothetical protein